MEVWIFILLFFICILLLKIYQVFKSALKRLEDIVFCEKLYALDLTNKLTEIILDVNHIKDCEEKLNDMDYSLNQIRDSLRDKSGDPIDLSKEYGFQD